MSYIHNCVSCYRQLITWTTIHKSTAPVKILYRTFDKVSVSILIIATSSFIRRRKKDFQIKFTVNYLMERVFMQRQMIKRVNEQVCLASKIKLEQQTKQK